MSGSTSGRRSRSLYFLAGVLVAIVGIFAFMFINDRGGTKKLEITIDVPKA